MCVHQRAKRRARARPCTVAELLYNSSARHCPHLTLPLTLSLSYSRAEKRAITLTQRLHPLPLGARLVGSEDDDEGDAGYDEGAAQHARACGRAVYAVYAISSPDTSSPLRFRTQQPPRDPPAGCGLTAPGRLRVSRVVPTTTLRLKHHAFVHCVPVQQRLIMESGAP